MTDEEIAAMEQALLAQQQPEEDVSPEEIPVEPAPLAGADLPMATPAPEPVAGRRPKPVKKNPDGSVEFDDGAVAYPGGFVKKRLGDQEVLIDPKGKQHFTKIKSVAEDDDTGSTIADAIINGHQPPELKGMYRHGPSIRAALEKKGYNLADAQNDWQAVQRHIATMEGPQQLRMRQAIDNTFHSLDVIEDLSNQWDAGGYPLLNKARLMSAKQGLLGPEAQKVATALDAQINDVTSELGNVYMGGNSPTDHSLSIAAKNLSADWSKDTLKTMLDQTRKNLVIRDNSIKNVGTSRPDNRYEAQPNVDLASKMPAAPPAPTPASVLAPQSQPMNHSAVETAARRVLADPKATPAAKEKAQAVLSRLGLQ